MTPPIPINDFNERKPDEYYERVNKALSVYTFLKNNTSMAYSDDELGFLICRGFPDDHEELLMTYNSELKEMEKTEAKEAMMTYSKIYLEAFNGFNSLKDEKRNIPDEYPEIVNVDEISIAIKNLDGRQYFTLRSNLSNLSNLNNL
ncbi:MAG: hypothetical protein KJ906_04090 [Nanoarchaeota archaeon]|nr:hypothetical protein [Nanoarchaeota archaeon]